MRDRYVYFTFVAIGAIMSFGLSSPERVRFLFAVPATCLFSALLYKQVEMSIGAMCLWLKTEYSNELERRLGHRIAHWDSSDIGRTYFSKSVFGRRSQALSLLYLFASLAALYVIVETYSAPAMEQALWTEYVLGVPRAYFFCTFLVVSAAAGFAAFVLLHSLNKDRKALHFQKAEKAAEANSE